MKLESLQGKYVIAVSGGVDSVVLLNLLHNQSQTNPNLKLIVAHFDHGIRPDSHKDLELVRDYTHKYGLGFYFKEGHLGKKTSEQIARESRYDFLKTIVKKEQASGLITAHHQDDLIETTILNIIRGTGRKGLTSLSSSKELCRPLLKYPKSEIINYAKSHNLTWREDSTNNDLKYLRNYIRHKIVTKLDDKSRIKLISLIDNQTELNKAIDDQLSGILKANLKANKLPRLWLNSLDSSLTREILAAWLRQNEVREFNRLTIERLSSQLKTIRTGKAVDVINKWVIVSSTDNLALEHVER